MSDTIALGKDFLAHAGVLGMKWGVRKSEEEIARDRKAAREDKKGLTPEQRKFAITAGITVGIGAAAVGAMLVLKTPFGKTQISKIKISKELKNATKYKSLKNGGRTFIDNMDDAILPKGSIFHRVAEEVEKGVVSPKYTTYIDKDILYYRKSWKGVMNHQGAFYKTQFEALSDAKIASRSSINKTALKIMDLPDTRGGKTLRQDLIDEAYDRAISVYKKPILRSEFENKTSEDLLEFALNGGGDSVWSKNSTVKIFDELKKQGFAGFTDRMDTGGNAAHSVILINDDLFRTTSSVLTDHERKAAASLLNRFYS